MNTVTTTITHNLDTAQTHETYNDLMTTIMSFIDTDQSFALALCDAQAEPCIGLRIELVKKVCSDWDIDYEQ